MGKRFLRIAAVYFVIAVVLGMAMGIAQKFSLASVHAHLNLLGWVSMALFGLIYHLYPQASQTKLASLHFWIHNLAVPVFQGGLFLEIISGGTIAIAGLMVMVGALVTVLGVLLYAINLWNHVK